MSDAVVECLLDLIANRPPRQKNVAYKAWESSIGQFILDLPQQQQAGAAELLAHHLMAQLLMPLEITAAWVVRQILLNAGMPAEVVAEIVQQILKKKVGEYVSR